MTDQKPPTSIEPWKPPAGSIVISETQFADLEKLARKQVNPWPYVIIGLIIILGSLIGGMFGVVYIMRPDPVVYPTPIPTQIVLIPPTVQPTDTPTKVPTVTLTPTKDIMDDMQVINAYYHLLAISDNETAWTCLTLKFRRDSFGNDFEAFKAFWSRTGPVAVSEIKPENDDGEKATALVRLYFYYEQRTRYYRFHLFYNPLDRIFQIDSVDNARPW
jgi:hypothetical protein